MKNKQWKTKKLTIKIKNKEQKKNQNKKIK